MATTVTIYDLEHYPDNGKSIIVDHKQIVPYGTMADEKWVISSSTSATASGSASIQDVYIRDFTLGWCLSTDFNQGPYTISDTQKTLQISINGSSYHEISLTPQTSAVSGDAVASDLQEKIRALSAAGAAEAGNLAFKNAWVLFDNGRFLIQSGSTANSYTGSDRTSVSVIAGSSNDVSVHLGFFASTTSEDIAGTSINETYFSDPYVTSSGYTYVEVNDSSITSAGECIAVTDGTNIEYRYVSSVVAGKININTSLTNDYAAESRVQVLRVQDPRSIPNSPLDSVDTITRFAIAGITNQVDFSS